MPNPTITVAHAVRTLPALAAIFMLCCPVVAASQGQGLEDELVEHLIGSWVLEGTIAGQETTHDVTIEWILQKQYIRMHEIAREKDADGKPAYEAYVHFGWNPDLQQYACLWLDITGGNGLVGTAIGHAVKEGDSLPFVFDDGTGSAIHNTFVYDRVTDTWQWAIDNTKGAETREFARVRLRRK